MSGGLEERITEAIWTELRRQGDEDTFGPCVVPADGVIDGIVNMDAVAAAVIAALDISEEIQEFRSFGRPVPLKVRRRVVSPWEPVPAVSEARGDDLRPSDG